MLIDILANIGLSMVMFLRGQPSDEKISKNITFLQSTEWFKQIYDKNEELFKTDENLRYIVGWAKVEKVGKSEKRMDKLKREIVEAINDR